MGGLLGTVPSPKECLPGFLSCQLSISLRPPVNSLFIKTNPFGNKQLHQLWGLHEAFIPGFYWMCYSLKLPFFILLLKVQRPSTPSLSLHLRQLFIDCCPLKNKFPVTDRLLCIFQQVWEMQPNNCWNTQDPSDYKFKITKRLWCVWGRRKTSDKFKKWHWKAGNLRNGKQHHQAKGNFSPDPGCGLQILGEMVRLEWTIVQNWTKSEHLPGYCWSHQKMLELRDAWLQQNLETQSKQWAVWLQSREISGLCQAAPVL